MLNSSIRGSLFASCQALDSGPEPLLSKDNARFEELMHKLGSSASSFALAAAVCIFALVGMAGCASNRLPDTLDNAAKRVAIISLVPEEVRVTRTAAFGAADPVFFDTHGKLRSTIEEVFAEQVSKARPRWTVVPLSYGIEVDNDREFNFAELRAGVRNQGALIGNGDAKIRAQVSRVAANRNLDAVFIVMEFSFGREREVFPGIGVTLVGVPPSTVSQAEVHCTVFVLVVDRQGNIITRAEVSGMYGAKIFDKDRQRFSYTPSENLKGERLAVMQSAVIQTLADNVRMQLVRVGL